MSLTRKTWLLDSKSFGGGTTYLFWAKDESSVSSGSNLSNTGWNVGREPVGSSAMMENGSEVSRNGFTTGNIGSGGTNTYIETNSVYCNTWNNSAGGDYPTGPAVIAQTGITNAYPFDAVVDPFSPPPGELSGVPWTISLDVIADSRSWESSAEGYVVFYMFRTIFAANGTWSRDLYGTANSSTVTGLTTNTAQTLTADLSATSGQSAALQHFNGGISKSSTPSLSDRSLITGYFTITCKWVISVANGGGGRDRNCDAMILYGTGTNSKITSSVFKKPVSLTT